VPDQPTESSPPTGMALPAVVVSRVSKEFSQPVDKVATLKERALHPVRSLERTVFSALDDVSFSIEPGEFFGLVGRNGSGKSTLLKCMAGIYEADSGAIHHDGSLASFIELGVGFNPELAAFENVLLNATLMGIGRDRARESFAQIMDFAELWEFETLKLKNYSSGMYVRLAFSVMLQIDADILLIDEILAVGDASFQQKCFDEFERMKADGKTIVFVTHGMDAINRFCDRAALLEKGRLVAVGPAEEVANKYLALNFERDPVSARLPQELPAATLQDVWVETPGGLRDVPLAQGDRFSLHGAMRFDGHVVNPRVVVTVLSEHQQVLMRFDIGHHEDFRSVFDTDDWLSFRIVTDCVLAPGRHLISVECDADEPSEALFAHHLVKDFVVDGVRSSAAAVEPEYVVEVDAHHDSKVSS
jgi:ABC-type polysaccharide/polyol phosphate transport system ATPase subunit